MAYDISKRVELKSAPEVLRLIRIAAPSYRKKSARLVATESVDLNGTYWDGGSRTTYTAVDMVTGVNRGAPQYAPPQFGGPRTVPQVALPENVAIVATGVFLGKPAEATVYVSHANLARLLPAE